MRIIKYLTPERTLLLRGESKDEVLRELVGVICGQEPDLDRDAILSALQRRETILSSRIEPRIALPHALLTGCGKPRIVLGYSAKGIPWDAPGEEPVNLVILSVCGRSYGNEHVAMMADIAESLRDSSILERMAEADSPRAIYDILREPPSIDRGAIGEGAVGLCRSMLRHAEAIAQETDASAVMVLADDMPDPALIAQYDMDMPLIVATSEAGVEVPDSDGPNRLLRVPGYGLERSHRVKLSLLYALSRGFVGRHDTVVCLSGADHSGSTNVLEVLDIGLEFRVLLAFQSELEAGDISHHVFHRVLQIASSLAIEGREGKPVGAIFVVGDYQNVQQRCYQMVINPFRGYPESERSILDPALEETIKEFSRVDGACLIRGDGVVMALGAYIRTEEAVDALQSGLGARHAAALAVTKSTRAISIAVSESTGRISLFQHGQLIVALERSRS